MKLISSALMTLFFLQFFISATKADWEIITEINGEGIPYIRSAAVSPDSSIYFGTDNGVFHCKNSVWEKLSSGYTPGIAVDNDGDLWVSKEYGLWHVSDGLWVNIPLDDSIKSIPRNLAVTPDGSLWCSTEEGVWKHDNSGWKQYSIKDGLFSDFVTFLTASPDGIIWCSYGDTGWCENCSPVGGVSRFDGAEWITYNLNDGLGSNLIYNIAAFNNDLVYAATENGLSIFNGTTWETVHETSLAINFDNIGNLWLFKSGLDNYLDKYNGIIWEKTKNTPPIILNDTKKVLASIDNSIWVASNTIYSGCILKYTDRTVSVYENYYSLPKCAFISSIYPNPFNGIVTIKYNLTIPELVDVAIYNISAV